MHYKERCRASNTGKLLLHFFPGSEIFVHGDPADYARLADRIQESQLAGTKVAVLYPSESSQSPASLFDENAEVPLTSNWDIILVDGTWRQTKRLVHDIPHGVHSVLPHIKLAPKTLSQFSCRRQSQEDRISTVEAAMLLLEELQIAQSERACVLESLAVLNLAVCAQGQGFDFVETKSRRGNNRLPKLAHSARDYFSPLK